MRSTRDDDSAVALDDQRRALLVAYASQLLRRSRQAELTPTESSAIARCATLPEAMRVIEKRRTPVKANVIATVPNVRARRQLSPLARLLHEVIPYLPMMWIVR